MGLFLSHLFHIMFTKISTKLIWFFMLGIRSIPSLLLVVISTWMILESPCWLVMKGRLVDAFQVVQRFTGNVDEAQHSLNNMRLVVGNPINVIGDVIDVPIRARVIWRELLLEQG